MATRTFDIGTIISVTDGHLVTDMGNLYELLDWMTGDQLFTHQLPRAANECAPSLREQFPELAAVVFPEGLRDLERIDAWLAAVVAEHGPTREVAPLAAADHTRIDPLEEIRMIRPDLPVIPVVLPDAPEQRRASGEIA